MKNKKGFLSVFFAFIVLAIIIITISAVIAPMGVLFTTEMYKAGEGILNQSNESLEGITNPEIKEAIGGSINSAKQATMDNIEVNSDIFQYGWVLVLGLIAIVLFLLSRSIVEYGGRGYV